MLVCDKGDEIAAQSIGINTHKHKLMALPYLHPGGACGAFASYNYIDSTSFTFETSIIISMTIMGCGNIPEVFWFNILYGLPEVLRFVAEHRQIVYGGTIILCHSLNQMAYWADLICAK